MIGILAGAVCLLAVAAAIHSSLIARHQRSIRALRASLTGVQSVGRVHCPHCLFELSWVPWRSPAEPSWWCAGCHHWVGLELARPGENSKINSGRTCGPPNDQGRSDDTQTTQTHETGVARE